MNKFRIYCGPTCVHTLATMLSGAGLHVALEGTEHVYVETRMTHYELFQSVKDLPFGLNYRDITPYGSN